MTFRLTQPTVSVIFAFGLFQNPIGCSALWSQTKPAIEANSSRDAIQAKLPTRDLGVTVGRSIIVDSPAQILRVSVANPDLVETVAINPHELLINGKLPGQTSMIVWSEGNQRLAFDLNVTPNTSHLDAVKAQLQHEFPGQKIEINLENETVFLHGTAKDVTTAQRAATIAGTLGKVVNLLKVDVPGIEPQVLIKVKFADVDRTATSEFAVNLFSTGATNTIGSISSGQSTTPIVNGTSTGTATGKYSISDALNVFLFRNDLNLGTTIQNLQTKGLLQILAEPNLLAIEGIPASFLSGGEFPFPSVQGGASAGAISISFRKYGVSIEFVAHITPRGTIRLQVIPEVSSLDFSNAVVIDGFNVPALATRRISTEIELESGQSFAIAGMLENNFTETMNRIPGLANIPLLGKIFESRTKSRTNSELLVLVTPELVKAVPADKAPQLEMPGAFISGITRIPPSTPGPGITGPVPTKPVVNIIPLEDLLEIQKQMKNTPAAPAMPTFQMVPFTTTTPGSQPGVTTTPSPINPIGSNPGQSFPSGSNPDIGPGSGQ
jgi:pilus assembly protein CpaC